MDALNLIAFKASDNPELCEKFAMGHVGVLKRFGITNISTNNLHWITHPGVWCVIAINPITQKIVGGIRLQKVEKSILLPFQIALSNYDPDVIQMISNNDDSIAEICALWISGEYNRSGISKVLFWSAISLCPKLEIKELYTLCAKYTLPMVEDAGFRLITRVGDNGIFNYPNASYQARILLQNDLVNLEGSVPTVKRMIIRLRRNLQSSFISAPGNRNILFNFDLYLDKQLKKF